MSRIGKKEITLPNGVRSELGPGQITFTGPQGSLSRALPSKLKFEVTDGVIKVAPIGHHHTDRALWGTYSAHLQKMIKGVSEGFTKTLLLEGVGFRAAVAGNVLTLNLGFSHPVEVTIPTGINVAVDKNQLTISGLDAELVGQFAATVRAYKPVEPYKGKGFRYADEVVRRKAGKKVTA